nr:carboxymuconolactone decarboxylase family protein [Paenibacillus shirakamiensis]
MELRMNHRNVAPEFYQAMASMDQVSGRTLGTVLKELIKIRVSQINGCAFCIDMHAKDLLKQGNQENRLLLLSVWHDAPCFTAEERAALQLTEHLAQITNQGVPQHIYDHARMYFEEKQILDIILVVNMISGWNRISIGTGMYPGCFD